MVVQATARRVVSQPVVSADRRPSYRALGVLWVLVNCLFWVWWLRPEHVDSPWLYVLFSVALWYDASFLPTVYFAYVGSMRRPVPMRPRPGLRVALVTPCVPASESLDVI